MPTIAPRGSATGPAELGKMELRARRLTEDFAKYIQSAHDINRAMSLELHAAAVLVRRKIRESTTGGLDRLAAGQAGRRATRPLLRAASLNDSAASQCLRCWRNYLHVVTEIQAARNARARGGRAQNI